MYQVAQKERGDAGRRLLLVLVLALLAGGLFALIAGRAANATPAVASQPQNVDGAQGCGWGVAAVMYRNVYNELNAIGGSSAEDIWAVGSSGEGNVGQLTLIEHWDGTAWGIVPSPSPGATENSLQGIAAIAPDNVWAVGYRGGATGGSYLTLILHWDGATWNMVPSPDPATISNQLMGVVAVSANDIWAVGSMWQGSIRYRTLVEHWDGTEWSVVASPNGSIQDNYLTAISAVSSTEVWAVGDYVTDGGAVVTLIERWNGTAWSIVSSPNVASTQNRLTSVSASQSGAVWAVGYTCTGNCFSFTLQSKMAMRWDGTAWNMVDLPNIGAVADYFLGVLVLSDSDVWAMGGNATAPTETRSLAMHWDGSAWSQATSGNPSPTQVEFRAVTALPNGGGLWAAGTFHYPGNPVFRTMVSPYLGPCGSVTATPTAPPATYTSTQTPTATATNTAAPTQVSTDTPTATPAVMVTQTPTEVVTASPTPCTMGFTDVHASDYFYTPVTYLACRGAISGYSDGTFRPYNDTTRGQLSKIVALAEGWQLSAPAQPTFRDVPVSSPFYPYIETAYSHRIISGYACGQGCLEYRPGNNITRAQLAKVVVLAQGWTSTPPAQPTFRDVPSTDPFYSYIEAAYAHDIISGYACGQGCLEYRPGNSATRGQIAKIVYGAVTGP